jgi:putative SOS response-associated peptidase YedK
MCFTVSTIKLKPEKLATLFDATAPQNLVSPMKNQAVISGFTHPNMVVLSSQNPHEFTKMFWGLIPSWTKGREDAKKFRVNNLNAKSETVFEKASFADAVVSRRCIVPVSGFFEWCTLNKDKYPYYIYVKETEIFGFAGIYETWLDSESGRSLNTFSIITTEANELMEKIHNTKKRMPLILSPDDAKIWLQTDQSESKLESLMKPFPNNKMEAFTIDKNYLKSNIQSNSLDLPKVVEYPELVFMDL